MKHWQTTKRKKVYEGRIGVYEDLVRLPNKKVIKHVF